MDFELQPVNQTPAAPSQTLDKSQSVYREVPQLDSSISPAEGRYVVAASSETSSVPPGGRVQTGWMPLILRPWSLMVFLVIYIGVFLTLIGLYVRSKREQGISTERESRHYLWTYGPTAVFIILAAFWRHLDYHVKLLMPWVELASGPKHAKLTVLLDYISPFQPVAFWDACKNRHWLVVLSAAAFATLKIATIFATGLFILQAAVLEDQHQDFLRYSDQFSAAGFDPSKIDSRASFTIFGVSALNLSYPAGTNRQYAIQSFVNTQNVSLDDIASISAPADVFSAQLDCQPARLNWTNDRDLQFETTPLSQFYNTTAYSPGCTLKRIRLDAPSWQGNTSQQGFYARIQNSTCDEISDPVAGNRLFLAMTYSTRENFTNTLQNYTAFVCEPSYTVRRSQVNIPSNRLDDYSALSIVRPLGDNTTIPGLTAKDLTDGIVTTLGQGSTQLAMSGWDKAFDSFFGLLTVLHPQLNYTAFNDPDLLKTAASDLYASLAAQVVGESLLQPATANTAVDATVMRYQQRLILRPVSVIVMEVIVGVLVMITIALLLMMPRHGVAPRDPSSLGALATILSRSKELERSLSGTSNLSEKDLEGWLNHYRFYSSVEASASGRKFKVELVDVFNTDSKQQDPDVFHKPVDSTRHSWWKPLGLKWWVIIPLVVLPVSIIVALEVLYRKSQRNRGLAYIPVEGYVHYTWVYLPALVMVTIVTLFNMLDYATRCIAPYQAMRADSTVASRGILYNPSGKLTLPALWHAIKEKHVTVIATTFAVLIAPVLTIAVSGLFYSNMFSDTSTFTVRQATWFNTSFPDFSGNNTDDVISGLIVGGNLSYPTWTYEDLSFAQLAVPDNSTSEASESVTLNVPAVRAALNCSIVSQDRYYNLSLDEDYASSSSPGQRLNLTDIPVAVNISMPGDCGNRGFIYNNITTLGDSLQHPETGFFGHLLALSGLRCPDFAVFYGRMQDNKIENFTTLLCNGWTQRVDVHATFLLPNFTIDTSAPPPQPVEDTARWFSNQTQYPGWTFAALNTNASAPEIFDDFISALVYGKYGTPLPELQNPNTLVSAVKRLYGITMTQTISQDTRIPDQNPSPVFIAGTSKTKPRARLVQSEASTRVLQVILAFIMVTTVVAYVGVKARELLPRESNSIATIGGYLAGSDVLRLVPDGAEWKEGTGAGTSGEWFKGYMFGFGWWDDPEHGRRRYGVGIGKSG
ncbi:hypothetical protein Dda_8294 [Drechslerella dactyloides]|uniref:Uncharacterized protein n=1 Tax=Drechslerella dactyloides TaxID=74499 RepID=A0AAD6IRS2_DREDA|nr:hypothetical protein Dda_8294 [Drechslerella dactyloides]